MRLRILPAFILACLLPPIAWSDDEGEEFFEAKIRPILVQHCLECHGPDKAESDLHLTSRESILVGGKSGPAAVERDPENSLLVNAIGYATELQMPPDDQLDDGQVALLTKWVEIGLPWPKDAAPILRADSEMVVREADREHWSFRPIENPPLPTVTNTAWPSTSIDSYVLAKLEAANLKPAPSADRATLIRRAYYDLIGLPPTYEEVQAFVVDPSPNAFEKIIDRLLASPRYGERWGRHWLDVARYADTKDGVLMYGDARLRPYAYTYRDYVVRATNEDLPYNQFVQQQLAADLIEPPVESWRLAALGFLTLGRQYDGNTHDVIDDQIDVMTRGFMGLTVACARCHDHKYDPIPTADYYSLYGVMASCESPAELPTIALGEASSERDDFECALYGKRYGLNQFVASQHAFLSDVARNRTGDYLVKIAAERQDPLENAVFFLSLAPEDLRPSIVIRWRRYLAEHAVPDDPVFGLWQDLMQIDDATSGSTAEAFATAAKTVLEKWSTVPGGSESAQCNPLVLAALQAATLNNRGDVASAYGKLLVEIYEKSVPSPRLRGEGQGEGLNDRSLERPIVAAAPNAEGPSSGPAVPGPPSPPPPAGEKEHASANDAFDLEVESREQLLALLTSTSSPCHIPLGQTHRYTSRAETDQYYAKLAELDLMAAISAVASPRAMVVFDKPEPVHPRIFTRGNPTLLGRPVARQFVAIATPGDRQPFSNGSGRLDLAQAITATDNPLTARVIVNRVWMYHFGEPLVSTPSDFGRRSTPPTHPELLDHLATRFVSEGWSLKKLHRWIMLSKAYQMASQVSEADVAAANAVDPENRLLWRMNRQRLDFESMRDTLLAVAGRLEDRAGGRPIDIIGDPNVACRTLYGLVDRQSMPSVFRAFDFATPDQSIERRPRTMMPQQALFALNSPFALSQAQAVTRRPEIATLQDSSERIRAIYRAVLAREPDESELNASLEFVTLPAAPQSALSNWEQFAQVLMSSNELMYVD